MDIVTKGFKTQLCNLKPAQIQYLKQSMGVRRFVYNWAVEMYFNSISKPSQYDLMNSLTHLKNTFSELSFLQDANVAMMAEALKDFSLAAKKYEKHKDIKSPRKGRPSFLKRGKSVESCRFYNKHDKDIAIESNHHISIMTRRGQPRLVLQTKESIKFLKNCDIKSTTISFECDHYYISIAYARKNLHKNRCGKGTVGIDAGIKHPMTIFNGWDFSTMDLPVNLNKTNHRIDVCSRRLNRTKSGSNRHSKARLQLQKAHMRKTNIRKDWHEKLTTSLVRENSLIKLDDFSFEDAKKLNINYNLYDIGICRLKERLKQKAEEYGAAVILVDHTKCATTQTCSRCGQRHAMKLSDRVFTCPSCGLVLDRDQNAAVNTFLY